MAIKTKVQLGEEAWLRLTPSQQLDLFKELIMERVELGDLLAVANKALDHLRIDVNGTMDQNAELVQLIEQQRIAIDGQESLNHLVDQQRAVIDGQAVELDRMERLLGGKVGH